MGRHRAAVSQTGREGRGGACHHAERAAVRRRQHQGGARRDRLQRWRRERVAAGGPGRGQQRFAKASAELSRQRYGSTDAPLATAMSTAVENTSTSTTIRTSLIGASVCTPARPHSQRRWYSAWSQITAVYAESLSQSAGSPKRKPRRLGSMERSRPVSPPPAPTSTKRCPPCAARYRMDSAQRTGLGTCSYRPCRAFAPVRTSCACQLFTSEQLKSEKSAAFKSAARRS